MCRFPQTWLLITNTLHDEMLYAQDMGKNIISISRLTFMAIWIMHTYFILLIHMVWSPDITVKLLDHFTLRVLRHYLNIKKHRKYDNTQSWKFIHILRFYVIVCFDTKYQNNTHRLELIEWFCTWKLSCLTNCLRTINFLANFDLHTFIGYHLRHAFMVINISQKTRLYFGCQLQK